MTTTSIGATTVVLLSSDPLLCDDVGRLSAAAGVEPLMLSDPAAVLAVWSSAATVLVGAADAASLAALQPTRREGVHLLVRGSDPAVFRDAVGLGAESVIELPHGEEGLLDLLTDADDGAHQQAPLLAVIGGSGGVGASVFAAALAQTMAGGRVNPLLVDGDPLGAGLDRVLGMEGVDGIRWDGLTRSTGRLGARSMRSALPSRDGLSVLSWPAETQPAVSAPAMREVLAAGVRGFGAVIVDLPRRLDASVLETLTRCDRVLLIAHASVPGVASAGRLARQLPRRDSVSLLVREHPRAVKADDVADVLELPCWGSVPHQRSITEAIDLGAGPLRGSKALRRVCASVADRVLEGLR